MAGKKRAIGGWVLGNTHWVCCAHNNQPGPLKEGRGGEVLKAKQQMNAGETLKSNSFQLNYEKFTQNALK